MKLSEKEKNYTFKQWLKVLWLAVRHPIRFLNYLEVRRQSEMSLEEKKADIKKYIDALSKEEK